MVTMLGMQCTQTGFVSLVVKKKKQWFLFPSRVKSTVLARFPLNINTTNMPFSKVSKVQAWNLFVVVIYSLSF